MGYRIFIGQAAKFITGSLPALPGREGNMYFGLTNIVGAVGMKRQKQQKTEVCQLVINLPLM
jgi:hypothetical protein